MCVCVCMCVLLLLSFAFCTVYISFRRWAVIFTPPRLARPRALYTRFVSPLRKHTHNIYPRLPPDQRSIEHSPPVERLIRRDIRRHDQRREIDGVFLRRIRVHRDRDRTLRGRAEPRRSGSCRGGGGGRRWPSNFTAGKGRLLGIRLHQLLPSFCRPRRLRSTRGT